MVINKVCGSGLNAIALAAQAVKLGDAEIVVADCMENMSRAPYLVEKARFGYRMGDGQLVDSMIRDGLWDAFNQYHMGDHRRKYLHRLPPDARRTGCVCPGEPTTRGACDCSRDLPQ